MYQSTSPLLCFPLCCLINYMGMQLVAMTELPIDKGTLVYGSDDAGLTVKMEDPEVNSLIKQASQQLLLAPHRVGPGAEKTVYSAVDLEGHRGRDGRIYVIDFR